MPSNAQPAEIEEVAAALAVIPNRDVSWEEWNKVGMALFAATEGSDEGLAAFDAWSQKSKKHDAGETKKKWGLYATSPPGRIGAGTIFWMADESGEDWRGEIDRVGESKGVTRGDFYAYMPQHSYIFVPTRELWPAASVNARVPPIRDGKDDSGKPKYVKASTWIDQNRPVEQMTWAPGEPTVVEGRLVSDGGWIEREGARSFNLYRPPIIKHGDAKRAGKWVDHVRRVYPDDADHLVAWFAQRVQNPQEKINHGIVLGGKPGIGKDTIVEPVTHAVGPWNVAEINPLQALGRFNGFLKSVILRINEARDLGDTNRFQLYEHLKPFTASPPNVLRIDEKHTNEYSILNCTGVVITTNREDSLHLPPDDRRYYVAWSTSEAKDFSTEYWDDLYAWFEDGGYGHVAAYLAGANIQLLNPKSPPPKTDAFWRVVNLNQAPEDDELADLIDKMGHPKATTIEKIWEAADGPDLFELRSWLADRRNNRVVPHRLSERGYASIRNVGAKDGRWVIGGRRRVVYVLKDLPIRDQHLAAQAFVRDEERNKLLKDNGIIPFDPKRKK